MNPWFAILSCCALLTCLLALTACASRKEWIAPETARKIVHMGMGIICLSFPWVFDETWPVLVLGTLAVTGLVTIRYSRLKNSIGSGLFAVSRHSLGEILFPVGVAWVFSMSKGDPVTYLPPILLLTIADTAGAIAGTRWGKRHFNAAGSVKSIEGSTAFALAAFLCVAAPLYVFSSFSLPLIIILAAVVSVFTMAVEGAAGHGADNLLLPVGSYFLLDYYLGLEQSDLLIRVIALVLLLALLLAFHRKHALNGAAILAASLFGYASFTLGGSACLLSGLVLFSIHLLVQRTIPRERCVKYSLDVIFAFALPSLFWLATNEGFGLAEPLSRMGFITALSASAAMLHAGTQLFLGRSTFSPQLCVLKALLVAAPAFLIQGLSSASFNLWIISTLVISYLSARVFYRWRSHANADAPDTWWKIAILALIASANVMSITLILCK